MSLMRRTLNRVRAMPFRSVPMENIFLRSALVNQSSIKFNTSVGSDSSTARADTRLKILYDGECPVCQAEIRFLKWWARKDNPINYVDISKGEYRAEDHMGITFEEAMGNMHAIGPDKKIYRKLDGIREMYRATGFGWFADFTEWPGIKPIADRSYDFFARNRFRLQGKTYEECVTGRCKIPGKK